VPAERPRAQLVLGEIEPFQSKMVA
jgi:hypothetical protein